MIIYKDLNFESFNTLHLNNKIKYLFEVENHDEIFILVYLFNFFKIKYYVLGNASKVVFKDEVVNNPIIYINSMFSKIYYLSNNEYLISSGLLLKDLILYLKEFNKGGFESMYPIPACIGGVLANNASDNKVTFSDFVKKVVILTKKGKIKVLNKKQLRFKYRSSLIKEKKYIVLYCLIKVKDVNKEIILMNIKDALLYRNKHQGSYKYSCGSLFKNEKKYKAYELIRKCNLYNLRVGDIALSDVHSNILINYGKGKSYEIILLVKLIKILVKKQFNITLKEELIIY